MKKRLLALLLVLMLVVSLLREMENTTSYD